MRFQYIVTYYSHEKTARISWSLNHSRGEPKHSAEHPRMRSVTAECVHREVFVFCVCFGKNRRVLDLIASVRVCVNRARGLFSCPRESERGREREKGKLQWGNERLSLRFTWRALRESSDSILTDTLTVLFKLLLLHCWEMTGKRCNRVCVC